LKEYNTRYERKFQRLQGFYQEFEGNRGGFTAAGLLLKSTDGFGWEEKGWRNLGFL